MTIIHITNINNNTKKYLIDKFSNKEKIKLIDLDDLNYKYLSEIISFNEYKISFKQKGIKTKQLEKDYIYKFKDDIFDLDNDGNREFILDDKDGKFDKDDKFDIFYFSYRFKNNNLIVSNNKKNFFFKHKLKFGFCSSKKVFFS